MSEEDKSKKGHGKKLKCASLTIQWDGVAHLIDLDAEGEEVNRTELPPNVIAYAVRNMLEDSLKSYIEYHEKKDAAENSSEETP